MLYFAIIFKEIIQMTDFELFIKQNGIKKKDIAKYIGSSAQFITQLCNGSRRLPPEKCALLKQNNEGWDTSMLHSDPPTIISAKATGNSSARVEIGSRNKNFCPEVSGDTDKDTRIAVLEKENEMLREQLEFMKTLIK